MRIEDGEDVGVSRPRDVIVIIGFLTAEQWTKPARKPDTRRRRRGRGRGNGTRKHGTERRRKKKTRKRGVMDCQRYA